MEAVAVGMVVIAVGTSDLGTPVLVDNVVARMVEVVEATPEDGDSGLLVFDDLVELVELMELSSLVDVLELRNPEVNVDETELDEVTRELLRSDVLVVLALSEVTVLLVLLELLEEAKLEVVVKPMLVGIAERLLVASLRETLSEDELPVSEVATDEVVADGSGLVVGEDKLADA